MVAWISVDLIDISHKQRRKVARSKVERHRAAFERGADVRPIDVVAHSSHEGTTRYRILGNGRHRYFGAIEAGLPVIECIIHDSALAW
jgi:hypothetical protein